MNRQLSVISGAFMDPQFDFANTYPSDLMLLDWQCDFSQYQSYARRGHRAPGRLAVLDLTGHVTPYVIWRKTEAYAFCPMTAFTQHRFSLWSTRGLVNPVPLFPSRQVVFDYSNGDTDRQRVDKWLPTTTWASFVQTRGIPHFNVVADLDPDSENSMSTLVSYVDFKDGALIVSKNRTDLASMTFRERVEVGDLVALRGPYESSSIQTVYNRSQKTPLESWKDCRAI